MKNTIIWEKWKDPFGLDDHEYDNVSYNNENEEENSDIIEEEIRTKRIRYQMLTTQFGIIPITENTASSHIFNFWTGHSNFPITKSVAKIIEDTDGVETLNIFTKYRFRIAIGKAFKDSDVMREINENVYSFLDT